MLPRVCHRRFLCCFRVGTLSRLLLRLDPFSFRHSPLITVSFADFSPVAAFVLLEVTDSDISEEILKF